MLDNSTDWEVIAKKHYEEHLFIEHQISQYWKSTRGEKNNFMPKKLFDVTQVAIASYSVYVQKLNFQTSLGVAIPTWQSLPVKEQEAWIEATRKTFELSIAYNDSST